ncbi:DUF2271 domain-containing protein [Wenyingzhuangia sp. 2_MG-2023]|uniref:DUF2271 domain-containing protein n=1 Tax=Wenyingzhuangia sp. 2_MG-2023 TaxID=3062639 RepID=UPI0026E1470C|nr:DUF2271 domain-containing protein [Wenyingzhuangia sp. 2_MG-2023]MDO6736449.1 DUF2271 domain-containing protein [Wenyingzhuangia sp. 2_MG-2023]
MKVSKYILSIVCLSLMAFSTFKNNEPTQKYKCMVQLKNYEGEGAYVIVSVVDKNDNYVKTLQILGDDDKWYPDLPKWWSFFETIKQPDTDAITGATIAGGERSVFVFHLSENDLNNGNKLRFETAVEHQDYHIKDLEVSLNPENLKNKYEGTGYIRYVRILPN